MSELTKHDTQFVEDMDGLFYQLFRAAGVAIDQNGLERIREIAQRFALAIEHRGEIKAIEVITVLQRSVTNAFKALEADLIARNAEVDNKFEALQAQVDKLTDPTLRGNRK
jgi:hypothetical protein